MAAASNNQRSEFFSDHPSDATRIKQIQGWMPEALKYYKPAATTTTKKSITKSTTKSTSTSKSTQTTKTLHISTKKKK
jgi:hypothetical protein